MQMKALDLRVRLAVDVAESRFLRFGNASFQAGILAAAAFPSDALRANPRRTTSPAHSSSRTRSYLPHRPNASRMQLALRRGSPRAATCRARAACYLESTYQEVWRVFGPVAPAAVGVHESR